ncbi:MAG TPA: SPFH domain-containing protein [Gemmatimonadaceae bacterium]|nr:SPFH domain-containing protein [Gemmatimonadaceae bacterium]
MLDNLLSQVGLVLGGVVLALILLVILTVKSLIVIVPPNIAAIITGRKRVSEEGGTVGYRTVMGGRTMRIPIIEQVNWLSLSTIPLELSVDDAFSKGNIPLNVKAIANVKIASDPEIVFNNAVERLLGKNISQIEALARETLTGNLRGVLAKLTPEEVNEDRLGFAKHLSDEADHDLKKLGLQLDVLKIQHVADKVGYLSSIGEKRTAEALRDAEIAKASAISETRQKQAEAHKLAEVAMADNEAEIKQRQAAARQLAQIAEANADAEIKQQQAVSRRMADVAGAEADVKIAEARNLLRVRQAELGREAETTERVAKFVALKAETEAKTEMETQRVIMEKTRLQADVVQPAEARRIAAEADAKALASPIFEAGKAQAEVLRMLYAEIQKAGDTGLQVFLAEKLPAMLGVTVDAMKNVQVDRLTIVDSGGGQGLANATTQKVNASIAALEQVAGALGLDLEKFVKRIQGTNDAEPKRVKSGE